MMQEYIDRRKVLKTLGGGVLGLVGATAATGQAAASSSDIELSGLDFNPEGLSVSTGDGGSIGVTWYHNDTAAGGSVHDVAIHQHKMNGRVTSPVLQLGDHFTATFTDKGSYLLVEGNGQRKRVKNWGGSVTLDVHCNLHPGMEMDDGLTVTRQ